MLHGNNKIVEVRNSASKFATLHWAKGRVAQHHPSWPKPDGTRRTGGMGLGNMGAVARKMGLRFAHKPDGGHRSPFTRGALRVCGLGATWWVFRWDVGEAR